MPNEGMVFGLMTTREECCIEKVRRVAWGGTLDDPNQRGKDNMKITIGAQHKQNVFDLLYMGLWRLWVAQNGSVLTWEYLWMPCPAHSENLFFDMFGSWAGDRVRQKKVVGPILQATYPNTLPTQTLSQAPTPSRSQHPGPGTYALRAAAPGAHGHRPG